jgi:4-cresol dehydrogenase (hydroxylating) flavoprotein subunit
VEPGVTQGCLDEILRQEGGTHYFNVTGAGLGASIVGNALERGIGYAGQRHFDLLDLEVALPSGEVVRTSRFRAQSRKAAFLGGLGPDPTGLFCHSTFGVVTAATIALYRRPEVMGGVICSLREAGSLPDLVTAVSGLIAEGACYGVPHIFNRERIVSTFAPHLSAAEADHLKATASAWTALIPLRGSKGVFSASAQHVEGILGPLGQIQIIGDDGDLKLSSLLHGHPSDFALASVAFSVFGGSSALNAPIEASGAGLIHVTPAVPFVGRTIARVEKLTRERLRRHGYQGVSLSLNALSARTAALIVSIGFDRRDAQKTKAAHLAAEDLLRAYARAGLLPYRLGLDQGNLLPQMDDPWREILGEMRRIFDPNNCMAQSRYEQLWTTNRGADLAESRHSNMRREKEELCIA